MKGSKNIFEAARWRWSDFLCFLQTVDWRSLSLLCFCSTGYGRDFDKNSCCCSLFVKALKLFFIGRALLSVTLSRLLLEVCYMTALDLQVFRGTFRPRCFAPNFLFEMHLSCCFNVELGIPRPSPLGRSLRINMFRTASASSGWGNRLRTG